MYNSEQLIELLKKNKYDVEFHHHEPLFTVEDSKNLRGKINGAHSKNLFLKNKKNEFFLLSCDEAEEIDLKRISKSLGLGNISFAKNEYLDQYLRVKPGSVSPFALLNDKFGSVNFYLEKKLYESEFINFHPLINTVTVTIETHQFIEFMIENNKKIHIFIAEEGKVLETYGK